jgi:hypothetical protein
MALDEEGNPEILGGGWRVVPHAQKIRDGVLWAGSNFVPQFRGCYTFLFQSAMAFAQGCRHKDVVARMLSQGCHRKDVVARTRNDVCLFS